MIGTLLGDRYEILERIGGGGMADVYKAYCKRLDRIVAVKVLKQEFVDDKDFVGKFKRESHSSAKLTHPNIVNVFDVGDEVVDGKQIYYIVMEYIDGKTLKEVIQEAGHLSVSKSLYYLKEMADAIAVAHKNNIVHRDIKPQNIMVTNEDTIKVTDFGIAKAANNATVTAGNDILGSVYYFSPEQARGKSTDERSDIYSLGIVFFEMLTGKVPFDADNPISIALKQVQESMPRPSSFNPSIPAELDRIILKMTEKEPAKRYSSVKELMSDVNSSDLKKRGLASDDSDNTVILPNQNEFARAEYDKSKKASDQKQIRRSTVKSPDRNRVTQNPKKKNNKKSSAGKSALGVILGIILALVLTTGVFVLLIKGFTGSKPDTTGDVEITESILGKTEEEAREYIEGLGFTFEVLPERKKNDAYNPNTVIDQGYSTGSSYKPKSFVVKVTLNEESDDLIEMPNVVDMTLEDAKRDLDKAGFFMRNIDTPEYEIIPADDEDTEEGIVVKQNPEAGTEVSLETKIKLTITKREEVEEVEKKEMINLYGMKQSAAEKALKNAGFDVGEVKDGYIDGLDKGDVMWQSVAKGIMTEVGTKVDLTINAGNSGDNDNDNEQIEPDEPTEPETNDEETNSSGIISRTIGINLPSDKETVVVQVIGYNPDQSRIKPDAFYQTVNTSDGSLSIPVSGVPGTRFDIYIDQVKPEGKNGYVLLGN